MVKLCVDDFEQVTMLETMLEQHKISYEMELTEGSYGIKPPHLVVDGVPLDFSRSIKWIKGQCEHE